MRTHLVTMVVSFDIVCNDNNTLHDNIYHELGYDVKGYANLVKDELKQHWLFNITEPMIKEITEIKTETQQLKTGDRIKIKYVEAEFNNRFVGKIGIVNYLRTGRNSIVAEFQDLDNEEMAFDPKQVEKIAG